MSIRQSVVSVERPIKPLFPADYHAEFLQRPFQDKVPSWKHVQPKSLLITVLKAAAMDFGQHATNPNYFPNKTGSFQDVALYFGRRWAPTILRDVAVVTVQRQYENLVVNHLLVQKPERAALYVQDLGKAGDREYRARLDAIPFERRNFVELLKARWDTAVNITINTAPYPAMIINAAIYTVNQAVLVGWELYKWWMRRTAWKVLNDRNAAPRDKAQANIDLGKYEARKDIVRTSAELFVRSCLSVLVEMAAAGVGTFIAPGVGTLVLGSYLGPSIVWMF